MAVCWRISFLVFQPDFQLNFLSHQDIQLANVERIGGDPNAAWPLQYISQQHHAKFWQGQLMETFGWAGKWTVDGLRQGGSHLFSTIS